MKPRQLCIAWLLLLGSWGCGPRKDPTANPDLLLVLLPGLRADAPASPAAEAALLGAFGDCPLRSATSAYSQSIATYLSTASILTGLYPSAIPLCGFADHRSSSISDQPWCSGLPEGRSTLPESLSVYGYRTALLHTGLLEQGQLEDRFARARALGAGAGGTPWPELREQALDFWTESDDPRLLVLLLGDFMASVPRLGTDGSRPDARATQARYLQTAQGLAPQLVDLVDRLEAGTTRPLLAAITAPHGLDLGEPRHPNEPQAALMSRAVYSDGTAQVPLLLLGSAVQQSSTIQQPVELIDLLPTLLARTGATLPASAPGQDLLAAEFQEDPAAVAYGELGDMLALRKGDWLLRFRTKVHHGSSLSSDLTDFLLQPPQAELDGYYLLFDSRSSSRPQLSLHMDHWDQVLELRQELIEVRTGPGAPHARALEPERLLELRMTAADGYW